MKRFLFSLLVIISLLTFSFQFSNAQCAACKESAESSLREGNTDAKGLNAGIMYLLVIPYILVGGIGYYWYTNNKKKQEEVTEE